MTRRTILSLAVFALALLLAASALAACGGSSGDASSGSSSPSGDVTATLKGDDAISQYADAFAAAGISGEGPFTVFAASNDALTAAGITLDADAVKASVIEGQDLSPADLQGQSTDSMLADNKLTTYMGSDGSLYVNDLKITGDPIKATNGTIYVVDGVIQPK